MPPFDPLGQAHLVALAATGVVAAGLVRLVRAWPRAGLAVRWVLFLVLALVLAFELAVWAREEWLTWRVLLPLQLCDAAMVLAFVSLAWPRRVVVEVLYFWACSGSALAMLTPELPWGFPSWEFVFFFALHGLVVVAALVLVFGTGLRPRPGAPWRAFGATLALAGVAGLADVLLGMNFMFLRSKPSASTPLDWMGPWPVYIGVGAALALGLFHLLALPFRGEWRRPQGA
jgi:hypothetical integral membrane protein (TIGR02206 family)